MEKYIPLRDLAGCLGLKEGDKVYIASDVKRLLYSCITNQDEKDLIVFIDSLQNIVGEEGLLIFPTFNYSFCKGETFDYWKTPSKMGHLTQLALSRKDFKRTKHPIHSMTVWGRERDILCEMENKTSFGMDSPFQYMKDNHVKNLFIDVPCAHSYAFVHYVEETVGVEYRFFKDFTSNYIDQWGNSSQRTYSMYARDLEKNAVHTNFDFEKEFQEIHVMRKFTMNGVDYKIIQDMGKTFPIIEKDVRYNKSRKICTYAGQED